MSSTTSTIFSGTSRYSSDFQSVITRAVNIASLPITQLSQTKIKLQDQASALAALQTSFSSLQGSLSGLGTAANKNSTVAVSSDYTIAQPTISDTVAAGSYKLDITDLGTFTAALSAESLDTVSDPTASGLTSAASVTLSVGGVDKVLTPASNSLNSLVSAINDANFGVQATIVNLGSSSSPDYRLSLESTKLGPVAVDLKANGVSLLDAPTQGTLAKYSINGLPAGGISSDTRTVTLTPGLTVSLAAKGTASINITTSTGALSSALTAFVTAYNSSQDALDQHRGKDGGALAGDSIINTLSSSMRQVLNYSLNGMSLADLGVKFDEGGKLQVDSTVAVGMNSTAMQKANTFLGSATTSGFLKFATDTLNGLADSSKGIIQSSAALLKTSITDQQDRIDETQKRVDDMQTQLTQRMAAADALIAQMEQKVTYFTSIFQAYLDSIKSSN